MIALELDGEDDTEVGWVHELADDRLWCDVELPGLRAQPMRRQAPAPLELGERATPVYDGPGDIGGVVRRIRCTRDEKGVRRIDVEDGPSFLVAANGDRVRRLASGDEASVDARLIEVAIGAPLVLALALRGVFVLHASAVHVDDGVIALTAATGVGKSTLAGVAAAADPGWSRIADDQLPVRLGTRPLALPRFPQLKLAREEACSPEEPAASTLLAVVELERRSSAHGEVELERLPPAEACALLGRATVAARLFDADLLATHLGAMAAATSRLVVGRARFPSGLERRVEVLSAIARLVRRPRSGGEDRDRSAGW